MSLRLHDVRHRASVYTSNRPDNIIDATLKYGLLAESLFSYSKSEARS